MVRTRLKLAATLTVVVLALTGFHTGHGSSSSGGGSGKSKSGKSRDGDSDGGGCSSSKKSNDDYEGDSGSGSDYGSSSGSGSYTTAPTPTPVSGARAEVVVVDCVKPAVKKRKGKPARAADQTATLKITPNDLQVRGTFVVVVKFNDAKGASVDTDIVEVTVNGAEKEFEVYVRDPKDVERVKSCTIGDVTER
ncbi:MULTISPECIES: hypothetical protein [unclassified Streptomyces]|uniref:hypothetical protein n=1 Tax=unclassified Streptomyces TaxID=2593676 RepID=UPI001E60D383|nr:hypothetical protein [Streptomyces sp. CB02980]MCB8907718.1 hypothetical protein [Streptomyces sp. CB02980]